MITASWYNGIELSANEKKLILQGSSEGVLLVLADGHRIGIEVHFELEELAADELIEFLWKWKREKCLLRKLRSQPDSP